MALVKVETCLQSSIKNRSKFSFKFFQVHCNPERRAKIVSNFGHTAEGVHHGTNDVEIELREVADFLKVF